MEKRALGKTGVKVSPIGFGGSEIGFGKNVTLESVNSIVSELQEAGINLVDTAAAYLESEKLLGGALEGRRDKFIISTKCGAIDGFTRSDWSRDGILKTVQQSLRNLKTDHVDVLLLHSCGELEFLWGEAAKALQEAKEKGYARFIGYSGDGGPALAAVRSGLFDVLETSLNIADQQAVTLTLPEAKAANMGVIIKRPIANAAWKTGQLPANPYHQEYFNRLKKLDYPFLKKPLSEAVSVALRFTLAQPGVSSAIIGTVTPGRFKENARILEEEPLEAAQISAIRARWKEVADDTWIGKI